MDSVQINGVNYSVGGKLRALPSVEKIDSQYRGIIKAGDIMIIKMIQRGERIHLGLYSKSPKPGWHGLDGQVEDGHGWWINEREATEYFSNKNGVAIVEDFEFKGKNLKNKEGRILAMLDNTDCFLIELRENVGGSSGDAMGRKGHCVIVNKNITREF